MSSPTTSLPLHARPEIEQRRWIILGVMCAALVMTVMGVSGLNVAIPTIVTELQASTTQLQWIIDAYALVFAGMLLSAGAIGDRFGRKGALLTGLGIFAAGAVLSALVSTPGALIATRAVMGFGAAFIMPATLSIITSVFAPAERAKAIAIWAGFAGAGGALGPVLSGLVLEQWWWGSVFLANLPIIAIVVVLVITMSPTSRDEQAERLDPVGAVLSIVGLVLVLFAIIEGPEKGWMSGLVIGTFLAGAAVTAGFVAWEQRIDHPMLPMSFFRSRAFSVGALAITIAFFAMFGLFFMLTQYLQFVREYSPLLAALAALPAAFTLIAVAPRSERLVRAVGTRGTLAIGFASLSVGFSVLSLLTPTSPYAIIAVGLVLLAGGMGLVMPPATTAIMSTVPVDKAGVGSAMNDTTREVGGALGIAVLGSVASSAYRAGVADLPASAPEAARDSIQGALAVARNAPPELAEQLVGTAQLAFTNAFNTTMLVSAGIGLLGLAVTLRFMGAGNAGEGGSMRDEAPTSAAPPVGVA